MSYSVLYLKTADYSGRLDDYISTRGVTHRPAYDGFQELIDNIIVYFPKIFKIILQPDEYEPTMFSRKITIETTQKSLEKLEKGGMLKISGLGTYYKTNDGKKCCNIKFQNNDDITCVIIY